MQPHPSLNDICNSLTDALINDPFYAAITVDFEDNPVERRARLSEYFRISIDEGQKIGICVLPADGLGAAIWIKPQPPPVSKQAYADKLALLSNVLGERGFDNYQRIIQFMTPHIDAIVDSSAWYLSILGVSPLSQGRGLGRALLEPVLAEVDREKVVSYLETFNPRTLPFYNRLGFVEVDSHTEPLTGETYWLLVRNPQ